jgi:hypothetical protein
VANPLPGLDVPFVDLKTGQMTQVWYSYLQAHQKAVQLPDVSTTAPTNGQVLIYNSATGLWTPGTN